MKHTGLSRIKNGPRAPLCVYIDGQTVHTGVIKIFQFSFSSASPHNLRTSRYQTHAKAGSVQSQWRLHLSNAKSQCWCNEPRPCRACDLSCRDAAGDSELSLLSTSPAHSPPPQQIPTLPSLLAYRQTILFSSLLPSDFLVPSGSSLLSFTAHPQQLPTLSCPRKSKLQLAGLHFTRIQP